MTDINLLTVGIAAVAAFLASGVWYGVFGSALIRSRASKSKDADSMGPTQIAIELARSAVVAFFIAYLFGQLEVASWQTGAWYGVLLWTAFPLVLLVGSVLHEKVSPKIAAIHAGDWLVKLILITIIISAWR